MHHSRIFGKYILNEDEGSNAILMGMVTVTLLKPRVQLETFLGSWNRYAHGLIDIVVKVVYDYCIYVFCHSCINNQSLISCSGLCRIFRGKYANTAVIDVGRMVNDAVP